MSNNKLLEKLKRLYQLAIIRPEEENDDARMNEARTAAFLLLKTAREGGVKINFSVPKEQAKSPRYTWDGQESPRYTVADPPPGPAYKPPTRPPGWNPFDERIPKESPPWERKERNESSDTRPASSASSFEDLFSSLFDPASVAAYRKRQRAKDEANRKNPPHESSREDLIDDLNETLKNGGSSTFVSPSRQTTARTPKPMFIKSTKPGHHCRECYAIVEPGEMVWWARGHGVSHEACGFEKLRTRTSSSRL